MAPLADQATPPSPEPQASSLNGFIPWAGEGLPAAETLAKAMEALMLERLCRYLGFQHPETALRWLLEQLEPSRNLQDVIFTLLQQER